jgi:spore coat protein I
MREYELEVLEQYDIEVKGARKIRGAYFCDTKEGTMLLKEADVSDRRAPLLYIVLMHLQQQGYRNIDTLIRNKSEEFISISRDGSKYMLKKWFTGKECDVKKESEVLEAVRNLAVLHQEMRWNPSGQQREMLAKYPETEPMIGRNLQEEFARHNRELKKIRSFVRDKVSKGAFESLFLQHFDDMYALAECVLDRLSESSYPSLYEDSVREKMLVHGDYNYHNILFTTEGIATTNFEHFKVDVQVQDLYYFLRKVMEKYQWDETLGREMMDAYQSVRPLDAREMECIALCLSYPEKFWKIVSTYYHSNKAWIPEKNVEKLRTSILQVQEKQRFIENLFSFHLEMPVV